MTIAASGLSASALGRTALVATVLSLASLLGGCVSAVDDSKAFGFNGKQDEGAKPAGSTETGDAAPDDPATAQTPADGLQAAAAAELSDGDRQAAGALAAAESEAAAKNAKAQEPPLASGRVAVAAYAGATVAPESETAQPVTLRPHANQTLFASLYAQSEAKTPLRNTAGSKSRRVILKNEGPPVPADGGALPGVKTNASLFEIGQRASADYDAEILEEANGEEGSYDVASLTGLARLAPNGLLVQRPDVQTSCFEPQLVSMLRSVEAHFHTKLVVTSGYRSPAHNRAVRGARKSMHLQCKAADVQVPGASNADVASYVRSLPGRGGVGTYCHTTAVHIDIGTQRDWNWSCRRRRA